MCTPKRIPILRAPTNMESTTVRVHLDLTLELLPDDYVLLAIDLSDLAIEETTDGAVARVVEIQGGVVSD